MQRLFAGGVISDSSQNLEYKSDAFTHEIDMGSHRSREDCFRCEDMVTAFAVLQVPQDPINSGIGPLWTQNHTLFMTTIFSL